MWQFDRHYTIISDVEIARIRQNRHPKNTPSSPPNRPVSPRKRGGEIGAKIREPEVATTPGPRNEERKNVVGWRARRALAGGRRLGVSLDAVLGDVQPLPLFLLADPHAHAELQQEQVPETQSALADRGV